MMPCSAAVALPSMTATASSDVPELVGSFFLVFTVGDDFGGVPCHVYHFEESQDKRDSYQHLTLTSLLSEYVTYLHICL